MLLNSFRLALAAAALAAPAAATASQPSRPAEPAQHRPAQNDPHSPRQAPPELICRSVETSGSDQAAMVCMTAADWQRAPQ